MMRRSALVILLTFSFQVLPVQAEWCPYCLRTYGEAAPGDWNRVMALRQEHELTCSARGAGKSTSSSSRQSSNRRGVVHLHNATHDPVTYRFRTRSGDSWEWNTIQPGGSYFHWREEPCRFDIKFSSSSGERFYSPDHNVIEGRDPEASDGRDYSFRIQSEGLNLVTGAEDLPPATPTPTRSWPDIPTRSASSLATGNPPPPSAFRSTIGASVEDPSPDLTLTFEARDRSRNLGAAWEARAARMLQRITAADFDHLNRTIPFTGIRSPTAVASARIGDQASPAPPVASIGRLAVREKLDLIRDREEVREKQAEFSQDSTVWIQKQAEMIRDHRRHDQAWATRLMAGLTREVPSPVQSVTLSDLQPGDILLVEPSDGPEGRGSRVLTYLDRVVTSLPQRDEVNPGTILKAARDFVSGDAFRPGPDSPSHALTFIGTSARGQPLYLDSQPGRGSHIIGRQEFEQSYGIRKMHVARVQTPVDGRELLETAVEVATKSRKAPGRETLGTRTDETDFGLFGSDLVCSEVAAFAVGRATGMKIEGHRLGPVDLTPSDFKDSRGAGKYFIIHPVRHP